MKRALISVSDKTGIIEFAQNLHNLGYEIISTGGTLKSLLEHDIKAIAVSEVTDFPEILTGRVKTLHPKIHAGILYSRGEDTHVKDMQTHQILPIDMLVVNLYPFESVISDKNSTWEEIIENIDIGGPTMLRAGAKNYKFVTVLSASSDYETVISEIKEHGDTLEATRMWLAQKVFAHVSKYDSLIATTISQHISGTLPDTRTPALVPHALRYGENPHQPATYYAPTDAMITVCYGKELSYNNLLDIDAAIKTIMRFAKSTVAILKHGNPCGIASDENIGIAYEKAFTTDKISPFGGVVVTNRPVDVPFVLAVNKVFTEIIIAPHYHDDAMQLLQHKKDRRLIKYDNEKVEKLRAMGQIVSCLDGHLSQDLDLSEDEAHLWTCPTKIKPSDADISQLTFAWQVVKMIKSNAICFTGNMQTLGIGIGQTSRIDSMNIAISKATNEGIDLRGSYCASDGFFPFRDSIDRLGEIGVKFVIQPGGSKSDPDVIVACDEHGIGMILTGRRHFRH